MSKLKCYGNKVNVIFISVSEIISISREIYILRKVAIKKVRDISIMTYFLTYGRDYMFIFAIQMW